MQASNSFEGRHDTQDNDIQHSDSAYRLVCDIQHYDQLSIMTLSITTLCHYAECHVFLNVMLNVFMLSVVMLSVVAPFEGFPPPFKTENRQQAHKELPSK